MSTDQDELLRILREQEAATARGDAGAVVVPMAHDIVTFDLPPPLAYRGDEARDTGTLNDWFATWDGGVSVELHDPKILVNGDLGVVFGLSRMRGDKKGEGPVDSWSRRTVVFGRRDGAWRIAHDHNSFPTNMDGSGASATDLKP